MRRRRDGEEQEHPGFAMSIYDNPGMDELMLAAGAVAYVSKGCDLDTLVETIRSFQFDPDDRVPCPA